MQKTITILGSTGSIGRQTLAIIRKHPREFKIIGLAGGKNWRLLSKQICEFRPRFVASQNPQKVGGGTQILPLEKLAATKCNLLVSAISGVAGLSPTLAALRKGTDVALANKECLVAAGDLLRRVMKKTGAQIFPIDSEHSGVWQLLEKLVPTQVGIPRNKVRRIILTASGGALRDLPLAQLKNVTPHRVLAHPTWQMGVKVTVDSATLANKAFEVIEAHHLFGLPFEKIDVVIHPQSIVHALVETIDGNIFAQLAHPDMRLPIQHALFRGERRASLINFLDLANLKLEFRKPDFRRFPLFKIILDAAKKGGLHPAVAAVADELAVRKFLAGEIKFLEISKFVARALRKVPRGHANLRNILAVTNY